MFKASNCWYCGRKESKNGEGCNNPDCKEYYKLKGAKNTEQKHTDCNLTHPAATQE